MTMGINEDIEALKSVLESSNNADLVDSIWQQNYESIRQEFAEFENEEYAPFLDKLSTAIAGQLTARDLQLDALLRMKNIEEVKANTLVGQAMMELQRNIPELSDQAALAIISKGVAEGKIPFTEKGGSNPDYYSNSLNEIEEYFNKVFGNDKEEYIKYRSLDKEQADRTSKFIDPEDFKKWR